MKLPGHLPVTCSSAAAVRIRGLPAAPPRSSHHPDPPPRGRQPATPGRSCWCTRRTTGRLLTVRWSRCRWNQSCWAAPSLERGRRL